MQMHEIASVLSREPDMVSEDGQALFWILGDFNGGHVWVGRYNGESDWTCHPDGDAFLQTVAGEATIRLQTGGAEETVNVGAGSICVIPRGTWHKYCATGWVTQFGATVGATLHRASDAQGEAPP